MCLHVWHVSNSLVCLQWASSLNIVVSTERLSSVRLTQLFCCQELLQGTTWMHVFATQAEQSDAAVYPNLDMFLLSQAYATQPLSQNLT